MLARARYWRFGGEDGLPHVLGGSHGTGVIDPHTRRTLQPHEPSSTRGATCAPRCTRHPGGGGFEASAKRGRRTDHQRTRQCPAERRVTQATGGQPRLLARRAISHATTP